MTDTRLHEEFSKKKSVDLSFKSYTFTNILIPFLIPNLFVSLYV